MTLKGPGKEQKLKQKGTRRNKQKQTSNGNRIGKELEHTMNRNRTEMKREIKLKGSRN